MSKNNTNKSNYHSSSILSTNDKAVLLMRSGRFAEAIDILRKLVLNRDCVWMRKEIPLIYKTNFAMALLLGGFPAGCRSLLAELNDETIPAVIKMRMTLKNWEKSMTLWQRLNWRWMGIEPNNSQIQFDGLPGDFETAIVETADSNVLNMSRPDLKTAV
jgi:hypothetical protein